MTLLIGQDLSFLALPHVNQIPNVTIVAKTFLEAGNSLCLEFCTVSNVKATMILIINHITTVVDQKIANCDNYLK